MANDIDSDEDWTKKPNSTSLDHEDLSLRIEIDNTRHESDEEKGGKKR